jgi:hypothetical protein
MIIYIIFIVLINILILNINIKNNKFYELNNILTQLKNTNIPDIYFTKLDIVLITYENNKNNTLNDIHVLNNIYNSIINLINRIDIIYTSDDIIQLKKQFLNLLHNYHKEKINIYNSKITYSTLNYNTNIYNNIFL